MHRCRHRRRSDAYAISENFTVSSARSPPLVIDLDKKNFKIVAQLEVHASPRRLLVSVTACPVP